MKKIFLAFATGVLICTSAIAQDKPGFRQGQMEAYAGPILFAGKKSTDNVYNLGIYAGVGVNAFTTDRLCLRLGLNYHSLFFNKENDLKNNLNYQDAEVSGTSASFLTITQELKYILWSNDRIAPYLLAGVSGAQGVKDGMTEIRQTDQVTTLRYRTGFRLLADAGAGMLYSMSEKINLLIEVRQNLEILESANRNLFYNFSQPSKRYNFLTISAGISYRWKQD